VAAGLCGLGTVFVGSVEGSAKMLSEAMPNPGATPGLDEIAQSIVAGFAAARTIIQTSVA
jgi:citrate synthase